MFYDKSFFTEDDVKSLDTMMEKAAAAGKKVSMDVANGWYLYSFYAGAGLNLSLADDGVNTVCNWNEAPGADVTQAVIDICKNPGFLALKDEEFTGKLKDGTWLPASTAPGVQTTLLKFGAIITLPASCLPIP